MISKSVSRRGMRGGKRLEWLGVATYSADDFARVVDNGNRLLQWHLEQKPLAGYRPVVEAAKRKSGRRNGVCKERFPEG